MNNTRLMVILIITTTLYVNVYSQSLSYIKTPCEDYIIRENSDFVANENGLFFVCKRKTDSFNYIATWNGKKSDIVKKIGVFIIGDSCLKPIQNINNNLVLIPSFYKKEQTQYTKLIIYNNDDIQEINCPSGWAFKRSNLISVSNKIYLVMDSSNYRGFFELIGSMLRRIELPSKITVGSGFINKWKENVLLPNDKLNSWIIYSPKFNNFITRNAVDDTSFYITNNSMGADVEDKFYFFSYDKYNSQIMLSYFSNNSYGTDRNDVLYSYLDSVPTPIKMCHDGHNIYMILNTTYRKFSIFKYELGTYKEILLDRNIFIDKWNTIAFYRNAIYFPVITNKGYQIARKTVE